MKTTQRSKICSLLLFALTIVSVLSRPATAQTLSFEQDVVSERDLNIQLSDFKFTASQADVTAEIIPGSLKWKRNDDQHLNPYIKLKIQTAASASKIIEPNAENENRNLIYNQQIFSATTNGSYTIEYNLFRPETLKLVAQDSRRSPIEIKPEIRSPSIADPILMDHSCYPHQLEIQTSINPIPAYVTTRCQLESYGEFRKETSVLSISLQSPQLTFASGAKSIQIRLHHSESSKVTATDQSGRNIQLTIKALVPKRFYRLKTALGFGPYIYQSKDQMKTYEEEITPSYMLYGKYDLTGLSSIKFFDALIATETVFNNSGLYFSYDLASALDQRLIVNALLGVQGIHYRFPGESNIQFTTTAPQGFEIIFRHPFGMKNYNFMYGGFFSTNQREPYINTWIRYGKGYFWELNYIKWEYEGKQLSMFGLSVGIPFMQFL